MQNLSRICKLRNLTNLNNKGLGTIEIILILVVLIALVIIFREQLLDLIARIFEAISSGSDTVMS
jgi:uncharacterized MnhB-related membrane protein